MNYIQNAETGSDSISSASTSGTENERHAPALPAKGSCWYCDRPVDNVRRFCSAACRDDYFVEEGEAGPERS